MYNPATYRPESEFCSYPATERMRRRVRARLAKGRFARLTPRQAMMLKLWIGTETRWPVSKTAIASIFGCSKTAVVHQMQDALYRLGLRDA